MMQLVTGADIFVDNYTPRVTKNLGLSYKELTKVKQDIIMLSLHGYGVIGPYSNTPAFGLCTDALSGVNSLIGYGDGIPIATGTTLSDPVSSLFGVFAVLAALDYRRETGKGQFIDLSMHDAIGCLMEEAILPYIMNKCEPHQLGARHPYMAPHGAYPCKGDDSWIAITVTSEKEWVNLCKVIANRAFTEERFSDPLSQWENQDELDRLIEQ